MRLRLSTILSAVRRLQPASVAQAEQASELASARADAAAEAAEKAKANSSAAAARASAAKAAGACIWLKEEMPRSPTVSALCPCCS
jgi:hypothetical protein